MIKLNFDFKFDEIKSKLNLDKFSLDKFKLENINLGKIDLGNFSFDKKKVIAVIAVCIAVTGGATVLSLRNNNEGTKTYASQDDGDDNLYFKAGENDFVFDLESQKLMMPIRRVIEGLGGNVSWSDDGRTMITLNETIIKVKPDTSEAELNGYAIVLDNPPKIANENLYADLDFYNECFGVDVIASEEDGKYKIDTKDLGGVIVYKNILDYSGENGDYSIQIPVITGFSDRAFEKDLNTKLSENAVLSVQSFVENIEIGAENSHWKSEISSIKRIEGTISLVVQEKKKINNLEYKYKSAVNIDIENCKELELSDLFKKDKYNDVIIEEIQKSTGKIVSSDELNKLKFCFDEKNLHIFVGEEQEQSDVTVPFNTLSKLLNDRFKTLSDI